MLVTLSGQLTQCAFEIEPHSINTPAFGEIGLFAIKFNINFIFSELKDEINIRFSHLTWCKMVNKCISFPKNVQNTPLNLEVRVKILTQGMKKV